MFLLLLSVVFSGLIIPRISKMSDKGKAVDFIKKEVSINQDNRYFFPPPYIESFVAINGFTNAELVYVDNSVITDNSLNDKTDNFLIVNDQASSVLLKGVEPKELVYGNSTWRIFRLEKEPGYSQQFKFAFKKSMVSEWISCFKKM